MLFVCSVAWLFLLGCYTSASDWVERLVSKMTYNVLMGTYLLTCLTATRQDLLKKKIYVYTYSIAT